MKRRVTSILLVFTMVVSIALTGCSGDKKETKSTTDNELS